MAKFNPKTILDVACGTADFSLSVRKRAKAAQITGIDISQEMLDIGRKKIKKKGLSDNIKLVSGDAEQLVFESSTFDAAAIAFGIRNIRNKEKTLTEIYRVLKPQGILIILEFSMPHNKIFRNLYAFYLYRILPTIGGTISGNYPAYKYFMQSVRTFPNPEVFSRMIQCNGFTVRLSKPLTGGIAWIYLAKKEAV